MKKLLLFCCSIMAMLIWLALPVHAAYDYSIIPAKYQAGYARAVGTNGAVSIAASTSVGYEVNFPLSPSSVTVTVGSDTINAGLIEIRAGSAGGTLLASIDIQAAFVGSSGWISKTIQAPLLAEVKGKTSIYVIGKKGTCDFKSISFTIPEEADIYSKFSDKDAYSDIADSKNKSKINMLADLGILDAGDMFDGNLMVTRRDFMRSLSRFFAEDSYAADASIYFADVAKDDADYRAFGVLTANGVLKADANGNLRPQAALTLADASELSCRLLNPNLEQNYQVIAQRLGILSGVDTSNAATLRKSDMAVILYNLLDLNYSDAYMVNSVGVGLKDEVPVLERTKGYIYGVGMVTANSSSDLYTASHAPLGYATIDGEQYEVGDTTAGNYLGFKCVFYYEEVDGSRVIRAIRPYRSVDYELLSSADIDFHELSDERISYYNDEGKLEKYKLGGSTIIVYNGKPTAESLSSLLDAETSQVEILTIDNNGDDIYDVLIIEHAESIIFGGLNGTTITDKLTNTEWVFEDTDNIKVFYGDVASTWQGVGMGDVLDIYASRNTSGTPIIRASISKNKVEGIVSSVNNAGEVVIDDITYKPYSSAVKAPIPGTYVTLKLNAFGRYVVYTEGSGDSLGVAIGAADLQGGPFASKLGLKLLTETEGVKILEFASNVIADGVKCDKEDLKSGHATFDALNAASEDTAVRYRLNSKGEIVMIDTKVSAGTGHPDDVLTEVCSSAASGINYRIEDNIIRSSTVAAYAPISADLRVAELWMTANETDPAAIRFEDMYNFKTSLARSSSMKRIKAYITKQDSMIADFIILYQRCAGWSTPVVVEKVTEVTNEAGEVVLKVQGYNESGARSYLVNSETIGLNGLRDKVRSLKPGDAVTVKLDAKQQIVDMMIHYFRDGLSTNAAGQTARLSDTGTHEAQEGDIYGMMFIGTVVERDGNFIKVNKGTEAAPVYDYVDLGKLKNAMYDPDTDKVTYNAGTSFVGVGSRIFVGGEPYIYTTKFIVIYK